MILIIFYHAQSHPSGGLKGNKLIPFSDFETPSNRQTKVLSRFDPCAPCAPVQGGPLSWVAFGGGSKKSTAKPPVNIRFNPAAKIGSKMDGEFTYPNMGSRWF